MLLTRRGLMGLLGAVVGGTLLEPFSRVFGTPRVSPTPPPAQGLTFSKIQAAKEVLDSANIPVEDRYMIAIGEAFAQQFDRAMVELAYQGHSKLEVPSWPKRNRFRVRKPSASGRFGKSRKTIRI